MTDKANWDRDRTYNLMPKPPQFSFEAHNITTEDRSGRATWEASHWDRGLWVAVKFSVVFPSFSDAMAFNDLIVQAAWEGGLAVGRHKLTGKVMEALK